MKRRRPDSGFAMLLVFAMAAAMAWVLYMELPRLAFEAQRNKEEMLVERGEQYIRGVQLFQRKNKKLPQTIEELEQTNGIRFIRRRYVDPLTGKDDWRVIHADAAGKLTDSLVKKQAKPGETGTGATEAPNPYSVGSTAMISTDPNAQMAGGPRRASEMQGAPGMVSANGQPPGGDGPPPSPQGFSQGMFPGLGSSPTVPTAPGLPGPFAQQGGYPNAAANSQTGGQLAPRQPQQQQQQNSGVYSVGGGGYSVGGSFTAAPANNGTLRLPGSGSTSFGPPLTGPMTGQTANGINTNPAMNMIQRLLTTPNPQGLAAAMGAQQSQGLGAGIIGFASKVDREGIKIYNEKTNYKEWEFVYDPAKEAGLGGAGGQMGGRPQIPGLQPGQSPIQMPGLIPGMNQGLQKRF